MHFKSTLIASLAVVLGLTAQTSAQVYTEEGGLMFELDKRQTDSASYTDDTKFKNHMLTVHNYYRSQHNVSMFVWSNDRAAASKRWSDQCRYAHSGTSGAGENIAIGFKEVRDVVNAWGLERTKYNFNSPGYSSAVGHFTQIVWKGTKQVGCSRKKCSGRWFVVCQYFPQGNVLPNANFGRNVLKQKWGKPADGYTLPLSRREAEPVAEAEPEPVPAPEAELVEFEERDLAVAPRASGAVSVKPNTSAFLGLFIALISVGFVQMLL